MTTEPRYILLQALPQNVTLHPTPINISTSVCPQQCWEESGQVKFQVIASQWLNWNAYHNGGTFQVLKSFHGDSVWLMSCAPPIKNCTVALHTETELLLGSTHVWRFPFHPTHIPLVRPQCRTCSWPEPFAFFPEMLKNWYQLALAILSQRSKCLMWYKPASCNHIQINLPIPIMFPN